MMLLLLPLFVGGSSGPCGPRPREIGSGVLASAPVIHVITVGVLWLLFRLWRRSEPQLHFPWRTHAGITCALAVLGLACVEYVDGEVALMALVVVGLACLTVTMIAWRIGFAIRRDARAFLIPTLVTIPLCIAPALVLAFAHLGRNSALPGFIIMGWFVLAGCGVVPALLVIGMLIEAARSGHRSGETVSRSGAARRSNP